MAIITSPLTDTSKAIRSTEFPTWILIISVYATWIVLLRLHGSLPVFGFVILMTICLTVFSSMCHELIHNHPTTNQKLNDALGTAPLGLIFPYQIYKLTHLQHHDNAKLTLPGIDPESYFNCPDAWKKTGFFRHAVCWLNMTLLGRLLLNPALALIALVRQACLDFLMIEHKQSDPARRPMWLLHFLLITGLLLLLRYRLHIPIWHYAIAAYAAQSMIQLRSFYEHRPHKQAHCRTVMMQTNWFMRLMFLNNNYHLVHHEHPGLPWYQIRPFYLQNKLDFDARSEGFNLSGYRQWLPFLCKPIAQPVHPEIPEKSEPDSR